MVSKLETTLPVGWKLVRFDDLFKITSSKRVHKKDWISEGIPFYRAREIVKISKNGFVDNELFISPKMYEEFNEKHGSPEEDDILVTGVGTLGVCYVVKPNDKFYFKDGNIIWFKKKVEVESRYIAYGFQSDYIRNQVYSGGGSTVATYTIVSAKNTTIPLPPLAEQKRIVAKIDTLFALIDKAISLTEESLIQAKNLLPSAITEVTKISKANAWKERRLGDILDIKRGGSPRPIKDFLTEEADGINWIKIGDATSSESEKYIYSTKQKIKPEGLSKTRYVKEGDFILSNSMSFGKPYIMKTDGCIHDGWLSLKIKDLESLNEDFLYYILSSSSIYNKFKALSSGTTVKNLNSAIVSSVSIPVPSLKEQLNIVKKLETISNRNIQLELSLEKKLTLFRTMKSSILKDAFTGQLL